MSNTKREEQTMKRTAIVIAVVAVVGAISSVAGAAGTSNRPVPYAPGSEYVISGSGQRVGTLTGQNLTAQFNTVQDLTSQ